MTGAVIDVGAGVELWASSIGEGPAVLLSGGLGMPPGTWAFTGLPEKLAAAGFRVITYAARGIAPSSAPPAPYSVPQMASDAARLLDRLDVDEAILVGYSMGCYVSQALLEVWGGRVAGLAMIGGLRSSTMGELVNRMELDLFDRLGEVPESVALFEQLTTTLSAAALRDNAQVTVWSDLMGGSSKVWTSSAGHHGQTAASYAWMTAGEPTVERLTAIECPTLVVGFGDDVFFPPAGSREAASHIRGARWVLIEGEGHGGLMLDPQHRAADQVVAFCTDLRA